MIEQRDHVHDVAIERWRRRAGGQQHAAEVERNHAECAFEIVGDRPPRRERHEPAIEQQDRHAARDTGDFVGQHGAAHDALPPRAAYARTRSALITLP